MDNNQLLRELAELNRLLSDHEKVQGSTPTYLKCSDKQEKIVNYHLKKRNMNNPSIFLNLKKLNSIHKGTTFDNSVKVLNHDKLKMASKVFINPNFRKSEILTSCHIATNLNSNSKEKNEKRQYLIKTVNDSLHQTENDYLKKQTLPSHNQKIYLNDCSTSGLKVAVQNNPTSNSRKIFFNPEFTPSSKVSAQLIDPSLNVIGKISKSGKSECSSSSSSSRIFTSTSEMDQRMLSMKMSRKRKVIIDGKKSMETCTIAHKIKKQSKNINGSVQKIFVNPNFERKENSCKNYCEISSNRSKSMDINFSSPTCSIAPTSVISSLNDPLPIPVLIGGKEVSNKFTSPIYPLCTLIGLNRATPDVKKATRPRMRSLSTSLVTVSRTKLVRKNKCKHKMIETSGKVQPRPLFLSKTKLVRNMNKNVDNNNCMAKVKTKQSNQKVVAQFPFVGRLHKSRRKSSTNPISVIQNPGCATKIKSKNGKFLKLIHKPTKGSLPTTEGAEENTQMMNSRKIELREQANRIAATLVHIRLKRHQFSKINVPVKEPHLKSGYNDIYKKNNVLRKPLTKAVLVGKKVAVNRMKYQVRNTPLDMTKFIRSKYRLIRKQSSNIVSKLKLNKETMIRRMSHHKMVQRKKLKWKRKSNISKRRLTRKDLSIKKIGGEFYRYSRTTLTKKKPSSETVSQLQNKVIYQAVPGRRYSRFCINKYPASKRASINGRPFATPRYGMSWKRTDYGSARSILTQANKKSVYLLSKKLRKNNEPCLLYHRYGRCSGLKQGTCVRLHDKKNVAVCKKFLQGSCTDDQCTLSHSPSSHNMPTCHHFLAGQCGRDNCVYPHIKVSDSAPICLDFLKGYCSLGDQCVKRHFELCPSFEKGICARGKYCPYPHPKNKTSGTLKGKFKHIKRKPKPPSEPELVSKPSLRYFEDAGLQKENQICLKEELEEDEDDKSEDEKEEDTCIKRRPQLGELPSFIPLTHSFQGEDT